MAVSGNTSPLGGAIGTNNSEIRSTVGRMLETEISRDAYRANKFNDLQLAKLRSSLYSLVATWAQGDKQNIISEYGDSGRMPNSNDRDYAEKLNEQTVETLIIRLPANELTALEGKAKQIQSQMTRDIGQIQSATQRRNRRYFNMGTMMDVSNATRGARNASEIYAGMRAVEPGFRVPRGMIGQYNRLRHEVAGLMNGYNDIELANTALGIGLDFPDGTSRRDIIEMICNQCALYASVVEGRTRGGISSRVAGAVGDNICKILEMTSFAYLAGKTSMGGKELRARQEAVRQGRRRMRERERQMTRRSTTFGTDFLSLSGGARGGLFFGQWKAAAKLRESDTSILAGKSLEELRTYAEQYGIDWTRYQDNDKMLEVQILRAMAADKRRGRQLTASESRSQFGIRRAGPLGMFRLPTFNRAASRNATDAMSAYRSVTGLNGSGGSLKELGEEAGGGSSSSGIIHLDSNGKPDVKAINYAMAVYVVGQGIGGQLKADYGDIPTAYRSKPEVWIGMSERQKSEARRREAGVDFFGFKTLRSRTDDANAARAKRETNDADRLRTIMAYVSSAGWSVKGSPKGTSDAALRRFFVNRNGVPNNIADEAIAAGKGRVILNNSPNANPITEESNQARRTFIIKAGVPTADPMSLILETTPVWIMGGLMGGGNIAGIDANAVSKSNAEKLVSVEKAFGVSDKNQFFANSGKSLFEDALSSDDKNKNSDAGFAAYRKGKHGAKKTAGDYYFNNAAKKMGFTGVLGYNVNGNGNKSHQNDALAVFVTNGFTEYMADSFEDSMTAILNTEGSIYSYLSTSLPVMFAGLQEGGLTVNAASAGAAATKAFQTVVDAALSAVAQKLKTSRSERKVQRYAKGGVGTQQSSFIAGDSADGGENQEMVNIDWAKRKFRVKPIPQVKPSVSKYADGGVETAASSKAGLAATERSAAMGVGIITNLVSYTRSLDGVKDDGTGKAIKVYSVNPSFADEIDFNGSKVSVIGIMAGMLEKLGSLESIMTSESQIMSAVASNTAAAASAAKSSSQQSSQTASSGFTNALDSVLRGQ
jgi:hypothetical protein